MLAATQLVVVSNSQEFIHNLSIERRPEQTVDPDGSCVIFSEVPLDDITVLGIVRDYRRRIIIKAEGNNLSKDDKVLPLANAEIVNLPEELS